MAVISAQQYYVDYGLELSIDRLSSLLPSYLPDSYIETQKDINYWIQVQHTFDVQVLCHCRLFYADVMVYWKSTLN